MDPSLISTQESDNVTSQPQPTQPSGSRKPKSDLFVKHMIKGPADPITGRIVVSCRHCDSTLKWMKSGGYGTLT